MFSTAPTLNILNNMQTQKIHPNLVTDDSGIKFLFNFDGSHFTMRFSGKPLYIIEEWYRMLWWRVSNFPALYERIKLGQEVDPLDLVLVKQAVDKSTEFLTVLQRIGNKNLSPFTIYAQPFDLFKYSKK